MSSRKFREEILKELKEHIQSYNMRDDTVT